ncbi:MAG: hypothetical protein QME51_02325 [Planctomycetota bacterium]|nr:hypothetical protein [Planctomycetota bacterium]MDI6787190.1 hypothetical protein [Planctomycetota bacterium]
MKFISKLSNRERFFLYITLLIVAIFLVESFIFSGMLQKTNSLGFEIEKLKNELTDNKNILSYKNIITKEYELYGKYLEKESNPDQELQKTVNSLVTQAGLLNADYKPLLLKGGNKYLIDLNAEGEMKKVINFMYNLNTVSSLLKIEKMNISPKTPKSEILKIYLQISKTVVN